MISERELVTKLLEEGGFDIVTGSQPYVVQ
jgi:hypothetical protein